MFIISQFLGMTISMQFEDDQPPSFRVSYNEDEAMIGIDGLDVLRGKLPGRVLGLAVEWAAIHQDELAANWDRCAAHQAPAKIEPLED